MRAYDSPYIADWFVISLRWITLVGLLVSLALGGGLVLSETWPIVLLLFWNVGMTFLAAANVRISFHRQVGLLVDILLTTIFFFLQGGVTGPAAWVSILPILTGSVYFEFLGASSAAVFFALVQFGSVWWWTRS